MSRLTAIVAGDCSSGRTLAADILRSAGISDIRQASDAALAYRRICERAADFMILDFDMPHDGLAALRRVRSPRSPRRDLPVIVATAYSRRDLIESIRDHGANAVLAKPLSRGLLLRHVEVVTSQPKPFIVSDNYVGPDRRWGASKHYLGALRRATDVADVLDIDVA